jgi:agmatinase
MHQLRRLVAPDGLLPNSANFPLMQIRYGSTSRSVVRDKWEKTLSSIYAAKVVILGMPSDIGTGPVPGSRFAPTGLRLQLSGQEGLYRALERQGVIDIGDVRATRFCANDQPFQKSIIERIQRDRWGQEGVDLALPISAHAMLQRSLECIYAINPHVRVLLIGGDHAYSYDPIKVLAERSDRQDLAVVQIDAHPDFGDLIDSVFIGHETWAQQAHNLIGGGHRLQQVGIRAVPSSMRADERQKFVDLEVGQYWTINDHGQPDNTDLRNAIEKILDQFRLGGIRRVYLSHDIDGTDWHYAGATGAAYGLAGLLPTFVQNLIGALGASQDFELVGADLMEIGPTLNGHIPDEPARTLALGAFYLFEQIKALHPVSLRVANPFSIPAPSDDSIVLQRPWTFEGLNPYRFS